MWASVQLAGGARSDARHSCAEVCGFGGDGVTAIGELLERVPFVAALAASEREALAAASKRRRFKRDEAIFDKDDAGESLFIID